MIAVVALFLLQLCVHGARAFVPAGDNPYVIPSNCKVSLECPSYDIVAHDRGGDFEIRQYKAPVWASTRPITSASYTDAAFQGFRTLFAYIEGKNQGDTKLPMTAPVLIQVSPSAGESAAYVVNFYVPKKYQTSPPLSPEVHIVRWPKGRRYAAVRRFGGFLNDTNVPAEIAALRLSLKGTPWDAQSTIKDYAVAGYNSPFEQNNRVNEVMLLFDSYV